jgi:hypothetical protein
MMRGSGIPGMDWYKKMRPKIIVIVVAEWITLIPLGLWDAFARSQASTAVVDIAIVIFIIIQLILSVIAGMSIKKITDTLWESPAKAILKRSAGALFFTVIPMSIVIIFLIVSFLYNL